MAAVENGNTLKMKDICVQFLIDGYLIGTVCRGEFGGSGDLPPTRDPPVLQIEIRRDLRKGDLFGCGTGALHACFMWASLQQFPVKL